MNKKKSALYVNTSTARVLVDYLLLKGVSKETLEETLHCKREELDVSDFRLSIDAYNHLWQLGIEHTQNPRLGLTLSQNPYNDEMGLVAHIFFNSPTLLAGLKQYERYYSLINESVHVEIETQNSLAFVKYICDYPELYNHADIEHSLAVSVLRVKQNIVEPLDLECVLFQHQQPTDLSQLAQYESVFPCPIKFEQAYSALVFKEAYLNYKLVKRSSYLFQLLSKHIESLYKKFRSPGTFTEQVNVILNKQLSVECVDAEHVADKLHMSRHTLYRKLKSEGVSFHELLDQVRENKSYNYLDEGKHSLSDIASLLGFSELSAFSRAFKRWTGMSPAKYQRAKK